MLTRPTVSALRAALPPATRSALDAARAAAEDASTDLWVVGGAVRDVVLGRPVHDLDLAFAGEPAAILRALQARLPGATVEFADRFGTASLLGEVRGVPVRLDLARLRTERYVAPGALPTVSPTDRVEDDLLRRDFTVNALALGLAGRRAGELVDPCAGLDDLAARRLRVLHSRSFEDDATRLWRGARTAALFDLAPDADTARLIEEGARWQEPISGDRLWAEFAATARRGRAGRTLALLERWGVLRGVHPAFAITEAAERALRRRSKPLAPSLLAAVVLAPLSQRAAILERLTPPREARLAVEDTARLLADHDRGDLRALARLEGVRDEARTAARWLDEERQQPLQRALRHWERTRPHLDAEALVRLGVPRGPALGRALAGLRRARYLGTLDTAAEARREVRRRLEAGEDWDERP